MGEPLEIGLTPTFITFIDGMGREWKAFALLAPLKTEDMAPTVIADTQDLSLKVKGIKIVRG